MYQSIFKFVVTTLTILTANLLTTFLTNMLIIHKWYTKPIRFTLIAMLIITVIFYPLFARLEVWLNNLSRRFLKAGKTLAGRYLGLILMFLAGLLILTYFYADMWYSINIFKMIGSGRILEMF
jgi:hypothetical protein